MGMTGEWCPPSSVKYELNICGVKNFSRAFIEGSINHRTNSVADHATSYQHEAAMVRYNRDRAKDGNLPADIASPIVCCLLRIDPTTRARMNKRFDVCYLLAKEGVAFTSITCLQVTAHTT